MGYFRFFLALLVIVVHCRGFRFDVYPDFGLAAVSAFFFISGFLMPRAFQQNYVSSNTINQIQRYALSRVLRIYPLYWLSLTIMGLILLRFKKSYGAEIGENPVLFIKQFLLIGLNQAELWGSDYRLNGPAWTLDIELQYYLLCPFLVLSLRRRKWMTLGIMSLLMAIGGMILLRGTGIIGLDRSLLAWSPAFGAGFLCAEFPRHAVRLLRSKALYGCLVASLVAASLLLTQTGALDVALSAVLWLYAAWLMLRPRVPESDRSKFFGDLSYPTYVLHTIFPTFALPSRLLKALGMPDLFATSWLADFAANVFCAVLAALAAHRFVAIGIETVRAGLRTQDREARENVPDRGVNSNVPEVANIS